jgi:peptidoglycan/LPS O-acetylase OafA/YrhL
MHNLFGSFNQGLGNGPLWSLGMEEQLYLLYMAFICLRMRLSFARAATLVFFISFVWSIAIRSSKVTLFLENIGPSGLLSFGAWEAWPFGYWFAWVLGALCAEVYVGNILLPHCLRVRGAVYGFGLMWLLLAITGKVLGETIENTAESGNIVRILRYGTSMSTLMAACTAFCVVNWWMDLEKRGRFPLRMALRFSWIGTISYSIYLTHVPVMRLCEAILPLTKDWAWIWLRFIVYVPLCIGVAYLFFVFVERKFLHGGLAR